MYFADYDKYVETHRIRSVSEDYRSIDIIAIK